MGGMIDTSVFVACERKGWPAKRTIAHLQQTVEGEVVLSAVVVAELTAGIYRARSADEAAIRTSFLQDIFRTFPPLPFTQNTAFIAGRIRGEQSRIGNSLPLGDSLIAAAAIELNLAVFTLNVKDFLRIPGLRVIPFLRP